MKLWKKFDKTVLLLFKVSTYIILGAIFFGVYAMELPQLRQASRTLAITLATFVGMLFFTLKIYGKYDINVRKSKYVVLSLTLSVLLTDIVSYGALWIMNYGAAEGYDLQEKSLLVLLLIFICQWVTIYILVYTGSALYFRLYTPEKTCFILDEAKDNQRYLRSFKRYKKQYQITDIIDYHHQDMYSIIDQSDHVFVLDVPITIRTEILNYCDQSWKKISYVPHIVDITSTINVDEVIDDFPIIHLHANRMTIEQRILKRLMDIVVSLVAIIISSPIWLVIAIAIKIEDGGSIFYRQDRITLNRKVFSIYKFRSMHEHRSDMSFKQAVENDERITKVGKVIRRFRVDELPQFLNVLIGDMSVVGPRPEAEESYKVISQEIPEFEYRTRMKAGITGLAQIYGKYNTPPLSKLKFDLIYIETFNIWLDIKLIFQTISVVFKKESVEVNKDDSAH